jgi:hypothetical protein
MTGPAWRRDGWYWRRRRNEGFGFWEDPGTGQRVGPVPLDDEGGPAYGPDERPSSRVAPADGPDHLSRSCRGPSAPPERGTRGGSRPS